MNTTFTKRCSGLLLKQAFAGILGLTTITTVTLTTLRLQVSLAEEAPTLEAPTEQLPGLLEEWRNLGAEKGKLGYPVTDEADYRDFGSQSGERISKFEHGFIRWRPTGILVKLDAGDCLSETGSYADEERAGINWCPQFTQP